MGGAGKRMVLTSEIALNNYLFLSLDFEAEHRVIFESHLLTEHPFCTNLWKVLGG